MNIDPEKYQLPYDTVNTVNPAEIAQHDNIAFRNVAASNVGVGTAANDYMVHFNFIRPEVCKAYNQVLGLTIDYTVADTGPITGDENTDYVGKDSFCRYIEGSTHGQIRYVWSAH